MRAHGKIVRPLDTPRLTAATRGVSRKMAEALNQASAQWEPRLLATIYAAAALEADDAHGREHHLVTQHYGIRYDDLLLVLAMAAEAVDGEHATTGKLHWQCARCDAVLALGRVQNAAQWTAAPGEVL